MSLRDPYPQPKRTGLVPLHEVVKQSDSYGEQADAIDDLPLNHPMRQAFIDLLESSADYGNQPIQPDNTLKRTQQFGRQALRNALQKPSQYWITSPSVLGESHRLISVAQKSQDLKLGCQIEMEIIAKASQASLEGASFLEIEGLVLKEIEAAKTEYHKDNPRLGQDLPPAFMMHNILNTAEASLRKLLSKIQAFEQHQRQRDN